MDAQFETHISEYLDHIKTDYARFNRGTDSVRQTMIDRFNAGTHVEIGTKYAKIVANGSAHSFIVLKDNGKFRAGDILKAQSWNAPAKNFTRGNVLDKNWARATWTGCL